MASTTRGAEFPTFSTANPAPKSMNRLPSASSTMPPWARCTNTGTVLNTALGTAASRRASNSRDRGPGISVTRRRSWGMSTAASLPNRASRGERAPGRKSRLDFVRSGLRCGARRRPRPPPHRSSARIVRTVQSGRDGPDRGDPSDPGAGPEAGRRTGRHRPADPMGPRQRARGSNAVAPGGRAPADHGDGPGEDPRPAASLRGAAVLRGAGRAGVRRGVLVRQGAQGRRRRRGPARFPGVRGALPGPVHCHHRGGVHQAGRRAGRCAPAVDRGPGPQDPGFSYSMVDRGDHVSVQPVGARGRVEAFLSIGKRDALGQFDRIVASHALSLLAIELDKSRAVAEAERRLKGDFLDSLVRGTLSAREAARGLGRFGLEGEGKVEVVALEGPVPIDDLAWAAEDILSRTDDGFLTAPRDDVLYVLLRPNGQGAVEELRRAVSERLGAAVLAGAGSPVAAAETGRSLREARYALQVCRVEGREGADFQTLGTYRLGAPPPAA